MSTNFSDDIPEQVRQRLVDLAFSLTERSQDDRLSDVRVYQVICQSLGEALAAKPYGGFVYAAGRKIKRADKNSVYELIGRLWQSFENIGRGEEYRNGANQMLSSSGMLLSLDAHGHLQPTASDVHHTDFEPARNPTI